MTNASHEYGDFFNRPDWGAGMRELIPAHMHDGLALYIIRGISPGHFLTAVLKGNLFEAAARADNVNALRLFQYTVFFYNCAPSGCFGSPEKVREWMRKGGAVSMKENSDD